MFLTSSILPLKYLFFCYLIMFGPAYIKILDWNTAKDKMWNGIGWHGFIGVITTSTTDISLSLSLIFVLQKVPVSSWSLSQRRSLSSTSQNPKADCFMRPQMVIDYGSFKPTNRHAVLDTGTLNSTGK